jgi:glycerol-3-phosphate dehydrogenase (NAD(P)+)
MKEVGTVRIGVVGAGAWGTTLASLLADRAATRLWAREPEVVDSIHCHHQNQPFLEGFRLPDALTATNDIAEAVADADVIIAAVPAQYLRSVMTAAQPFVAKQALIVNVAKGIEQGTGRRMSQVLSEALFDHDQDAIGVLSGPNLAREIMCGQPAATCVGFSHLSKAAVVQSLLAGDVLRVYTSDDIIGCEIGGAGKNVIAIAAGVGDGLGYGTNTKAALITRGLAELSRLGVAVGGRPLTFLGLAGNGDLVATCTSSHSRNRRVGEELGKGRALQDIVGGMKQVAEGVATAPALLAMAAAAGVEMPISSTVATLLSGELSAADVVPLLMRRSPKAELHGLAI